jgi:hypothetical protein
VPRQKGHCWFLARGEHVQFPSSKLSYHIIILSAMIIIKKNHWTSSLFKQNVSEGKIWRIPLIQICTQLEYHALMNFSPLLKIWTFLRFCIMVGFMSIPKPSGKKCLIGL